MDQDILQTNTPRYHQLNMNPESTQASCDLDTLFHAPHTNYMDQDILQDKQSKVSPTQYEPWINTDLL